MQNSVAGITTAPRTNPTLARCVESIATAGWAPTIFAEPYTDLEAVDCEVVQWDTRLGAWHNFRAMCESLLEKPARFIAVFQDDVLLSTVAREMCERFPWPRDCAAISLYTPRDFPNDREGWVASNQLHWGALGYVFRRGDLRKLLDAPKWTNRPCLSGKVDYLVCAGVAGHLRKSICYHVPSLGQHIATHSAMGHGDNRGRRRASKVLMSIPDEWYGRTLAPRTYRVDNRKLRRRHSAAIHLVNRCNRSGLTVLDVDGRMSSGVGYLAGLPRHTCTSLEADDGGLRLKGVRFQKGCVDDIDDQYDVVLCLDMATSFVKDLLTIARSQVVVSFPASRCANVADLFGVEPAEKKLVSDVDGEWWVMSFSTSQPRPQSRTNSL